MKWRVVMVSGTKWYRSKDYMRSGRVAARSKTILGSLVKASSLGAKKVKGPRNGEKWTLDIGALARVIGQSVCITVLYG